MDELCRIHSSFSSSSCTAATVADHGGGGGEGGGGGADDHEDENYYIVPASRGIRIVNNENEEVTMMMMMGSDISDILKAQISNHPLYPNLISSYIECRKVGAPPEMVSLLDDISKKRHQQQQHPITEMGADPELDQFMESYCEALKKYKEELLKPFHEATTFLNDIESQLLHLCKDINLTTTSSSFTSVNYHHDYDEAGGVTSDDEDHDEDAISCGEVEIGDSQESSSGGGGGGGDGGGGGVHQAAESEIKEMLMRKYSGYLSSLRKEFLKKRKKGKLPKNARLALLDWWNTHYRWPYPTEEEKNKLSEVTGLDQRQINNWFINQRKRHWRPSEDMRFALMQGVTATVTQPQPPPPPVAVAPPVYFDTAGGSAGF